MSNSFWDNVETTDDGNFEAGSGSFEPLPENTEALAMISEAKMDDYQGDQYISLTWDILKPEEHKNRKIFQKVRVYDDKPEKAAKARRMLAAIDQNANPNGGLMATGQAPSDMNLQQFLSNKIMFIKLGVWELDDKSNSGNWVKAVGPKSRYDEAPVQAPTNANGAEDDVPF